MGWVLVDEALEGKRYCNCTDSIRNLWGNPYVLVLVRNLVIDDVLPPLHEGLLRLVVAVEGGGLLDGETLGLAVAPDEEVNGVVQLAVESLLNVIRKRYGNCAVSTVFLWQAFLHVAKIHCKAKVPFLKCYSETVRKLQ